MTLTLLAAAVLISAPACSKLDGTDPIPTRTAATPRPSAVPTPTPPAAALAGGACLLMDYSMINKALGSAFDVAASAITGQTYTCDIEGSTASLPDLNISITATDLSPSDFTAHVKPSGATAVSKLGKIGYLDRVKASGDDGPGLEVGWLSGNDRLIVMRYTFPASATDDDVSALADGMTSLARTVDATTV